MLHGLCRCLDASSLWGPQYGTGVTATLMFPWFGDSRRWGLRRYLRSPHFWDPNTAMPSISRGRKGVLPKNGAITLN